MDTLAFGYILPATGRIRDFDPLENVRRRAHHHKKWPYRLFVKVDKTIFYPDIYYCTCKPPATRNKIEYRPFAVLLSKYYHLKL